jgi:hypothetical protein
MCLDSTLRQQLLSEFGQALTYVYRVLRDAPSRMPPRVASC